MLLVENLHSALQGKIEQLQAQIIEHLRNQNLTETAHQQVHKEVAELRGMAATLGARPEKHPDKNLAPGSYTLTKSQWPTWSLRFRRYMNRRHPGLADKMLKVEGKPTPLKADVLEAADVDPLVNEDLMD